MGVIAQINRAILYKVEIEPYPTGYSKKYRRLKKPHYEIYIVADDGGWRWPDKEKKKYYTSLKEAKIKFLLAAI